MRTTGTDVRFWDNTASAHLLLCLVSAQPNSASVRAGFEAADPQGPPSGSLTEWRTVRCQVSEAWLRTTNAGGCTEYSVRIWNLFHEAFGLLTYSPEFTRDVTSSVVTNLPSLSGWVGGVLKESSGIMPSSAVFFLLFSGVLSFMRADRCRTHSVIMYAQHDSTYATVA